jgi:aminoglycoside phosphotransferase (APT) family kinase protein
VNPIDQAIGVSLSEAELGRVATVAPELVAPFSAELISGGRSNLTYGLLDGGGRRYVLRRPPLGELAASAHDVAREWGIVSALSSTDVPVPRPVALCEDPALIGAPFFVMEFVAGETLEDPASAGRLTEAACADAASSLIAILARLHRHDVAALGLGALVRPGRLIERQLRRWGRQLDSYDALTSDLIRSVGADLERRIPPEQSVSLVHGDYKLNNLRIDEAGEVVAVLDWELAAVGDPLVDLGWLLASWGRPSDEGTWIVEPPSLAAGFPDREVLVERYAAESGMCLEQIEYYIAFAYWRWSCINEGIRARFERGAMGEKRIDLDRVKAQIQWQLEAAAELLA